MALNAAEEETLEAFKAWWRENGKGLVITAIVIVGGYTSWLVWQNTQAASSAAASDLYEQVLNLAVTDPGVSISAEDRRRVIELAEQLRTEFPGSDYARFASLFAAQQHVSLDDLSAAESALRWILNNPKRGLLTDADVGLQLTANLRLGRVLLAQGQAEQALELINSVDPQGFESRYAELRGDIYVSMGRIVDARDAYVAAQQAGSVSQTLQMKLNSLGEDS